jgi:hypothetical protein
MKTGGPGLRRGVEVYSEGTGETEPDSSAGVWRRNGVSGGMSIKGGKRRGAFSGGGPSDFEGFAPAMTSLPVSFPFLSISLVFVLLYVV